MNQISIKRRHDVGLLRARQLSEKMARELQQRYGLRWRWEGDRLKFSNASARGFLDVDDVLVKLELRLGLTLMAFAPVMEQSIRKELDEVIAAA